MFFKQDSGKPEAPARRTLPALPLRDIIVFPHMSSRLFVGREKSIAALEEAMGRDKEIFLAAQKNAAQVKKPVRIVRQGLHFYFAAEALRTQNLPDD